MLTGTKDNHPGNEQIRFIISRISILRAINQSNNADFKPNTIHILIFPSTYWYFMHPAKKYENSAQRCQFAEQPIWKFVLVAPFSSAPLLPWFAKVLPRKDAFNVFVVVIVPHCNHRSVGNTNINCLLAVSVFNLPDDYFRIITKMRVVRSGSCHNFYERVSMYFRQA